MHLLYLSQAYRFENVHANAPNFLSFQYYCRNGAALGGNVCTASPISDLNPIWIAAGATFEVASAERGRRSIPAASFFVGYRKVDMAPDEVLVSVHVPFTQQYEYVKEFKQAHRRDDDIAIVNAGVRIKLTPGADGSAWVVEDASIAFGGVAALTVSAPKTAAALIGRVLDAGCVSAALDAVKEDVNISADAPGGMVEYRRSLAASFVLKGIVHAATALEADAPADLPFQLPFDQSYRSAVQVYHRPPCSGLQYYTPPGEANVVGQPHRHAAADMQVTGEAVYVDDMPLPPKCLHAAMVMSTRPHARLVSVNTQPGAEVPGVVAVFTEKDVPGGNDIGAVVHDEELFAKVRVVHLLLLCATCTLRHDPITVSCW